MALFEASCSNSILKDGVRDYGVNVCLEGRAFIAGKWYCGSSCLLHALRAIFIAGFIV